MQKKADSSILMMKKGLKNTGVMRAFSTCVVVPYNTQLNMKIIYTSAKMSKYVICLSLLRQVLSEILILLCCLCNQGNLNTESADI